MKNRFLAACCCCQPTAFHSEARPISPTARSSRPADRLQPSVRLSAADHPSVFSRPSACSRPSAAVRPLRFTAVFQKIMIFHIFEYPIRQKSISGRPIVLFRFAQIFPTVVHLRSSNMKCFGIISMISYFTRPQESGIHIVKNKCE